MKTTQIANVYKLINPAKLTKMDDADKFKVIKAIRAIKPIAISFEESIKDAQERLKDEQYPVMEQRANKWNEKYGNKKIERSDVPEEDLTELEEINAYFAAYRKLVEDFIKEEADKEYELTFDKLSEDAFAKFIASNDFDVKTIIGLQDVLM